LGVKRSQIWLIVFFKLLLVRHVTAVAIDLPTFRESAEGEAGVVLHDDKAVFEKEIAYSGEAVPMH